MTLAAAYALSAPVNPPPAEVDPLRLAEFDSESLYTAVVRLPSDATIPSSVLEKNAAALGRGLAASLSSSDERVRAEAEGALAGDAGTLAPFTVRGGPNLEPNAADRIALSLESIVDDRLRLASGEERQRLLAILGRTPTETAMRTLANAIDEPEDRRAALEAIARAPVKSVPPEAVGAALQATKDPDFRLRSASVRALGRLMARGAHDRSLAALERLALSDAYALVRDQALREIQRADAGAGGRRRAPRLVERARSAGARAGRAPRRRQAALMLVLGIETSCDETAAAVVTAGGEVRSDVVHSQIALHAPYGGIVPELASRDHLATLDGVVGRALDQAGVSFTDLAGVAVTCRPGLVGALLVGVQYAKALAFGRGLPIVGVDHLIGHLFSVFLQRPGDAPPRPEFPFVALLASGGHTALYAVDSETEIRELGATRDDAAGEAFDKVAKLLGLGYPGGPRIDQLSTAGDPARFELPRSLPGSLEFSFSGVKTQVARLIERGVIDPGSPRDVADAAASFQRTCVGVLVDKLLRAARQERATSIVLGGGVAANRELRAATLREAERCGLHACLPCLANTTDNAAMIAYVGARRLERGERDELSLGAFSSTSLPRTTRKGRGERRSV